MFFVNNVFIIDIVIFGVTYFIDNLPYFFYLNSFIVNVSYISFIHQLNKFFLSTNIKKFISVFVAKYADVNDFPSPVGNYHIHYLIP